MDLALICVFNKNPSQYIFRFMTDDKHRFNGGHTVNLYGSKRIGKICVAVNDGVEMISLVC